MTKEQRPTSKVIQITPIYYRDTYEMFNVVCEDGSIWFNFAGKNWVCILEPHEEPEGEE